MVFVKQYAAPPVQMEEILRYAAARGSGEDVRTLAEECLAEAEKCLVYQVCFRELPIKRENGKLDLGFSSTDSKTLGKALADCDRLILFAATLGIAMDRLIAKYARLSPAKAWMLQAIGAERIEALCDAFCHDISCENEKNTRPRVSPGYGDIPLAMQKEIFAALDCPRKIGLSLNASLIMSPTKSVTAFVGLFEGEVDERS